MTPEHDHIKLPLRSAPVECWPRIVNRLDQEEILHGKLATLPLHEAPDVWSAIEAATPSRSSRHLLMWTLRVAAILMIGSVVWIIAGPYREARTITVSKEMALANEGFNQPDVSTGASELIGRASDQTEGIAANQAFREMMDDLDLLETEQAELEQEIGKNGTLPELIKARIDVENRKAQITKNLVRIIML